MCADSNRQETEATLRVRAVTRLTGDSAPASGRLDSSAAFQALYELALSPDTAPRALALLHEIQVHQVELELQDEELRRSRAELEAVVLRQTQLYDHAPVGFFTVDHATVLYELNLPGARMLGVDRDALLGRSLEQFLTSESAAELRSMLSRVGSGAGTECRALRLNVPAGRPRAVQVSGSRDAAGSKFLVAFLDLGVQAGPQAT